VKSDRIELCLELPSLPALSTFGFCWLSVNRSTALDLSIATIALNLIGVEVYP
jgi:hypothetical protein